jgi:mannose-6-phosphate isomerase-like protein (cupin superfamily)
MIVHRNTMQVERKEKMRGGEGVVSITHFVDGTTQKHARMLAEITLPLGAAIGNHPHDDETEYFIFLEGEGVVNDNGTEAPVKPGDVMITGNGAFHGVKNTGSVPLVFNAIIVTH